MRMSNKGSQPLCSKFLRISPSNSSNTTFCSAHTFLRMFSFSYVYWFFSLRNLSLSKNGAKEEEEAFLFALVFLVMMLRKDKTDTKETKKEEQRKKTKCRLQVSTKKKYIENNNLYDAWTMSTHDACSNVVRMSSILLWNHKIGLSIEFISKTPNFENPLSKNSTIWLIYHYTR